MISKILEPVLNIARHHKLKLLALLGFYLVFMYFLFPFNDLGDLVASKVSQLTQGQVFVDFDKLDLSLFPQPGLELTNVNVETAFTPALTARVLSVAPSLTGLLTFKPGVSVHAEDLLGGDVDLSTRGGGKTKSGTREQKISLDLSTLSLASISRIAGLPMKIDGALSGSVESQVDPDFNNQPTADVDLQIARTVIPEGNIITPFGPFGVPRLDLNDVVLQARAEKGSVEVVRFVFGKAGGDLSGNVTGRMDVKLQRMGTMVNPIFGGYDFSVHLQVSDNFKQKFGPYLGFLSGYQNGANAYAFRVYGANFYNPPGLTKIQ